MHLMVSQIYYYPNYEGTGVYGLEYRGQLRKTFPAAIAVSAFFPVDFALSASFFVLAAGMHYRLQNENSGNGWKHERNAMERVMPCHHA